MDHGNLAQGIEAAEAALVRAALEGCTESLGVLLERYRPRLYAQAVALLGYKSDTEDAVHDTFLTAIARLGQLRDPAAFGGWLHAILRSRCLMQHRRNRLKVGGPEAERHLRDIPDEERIETGIQSRELRNWVWAALQHLPETQRAAVLLRYFGSFDTYEEISVVLGVPVGTVRSRLFDAKIRLSELLLSAARPRDDRHAKIQTERQAFYKDAFHALYSGRRDEFLSHYADDLHLSWSTGARSRGRMYFDAEMDSDLRTGVRLQLRRIMASGNLTVVEGALRNPPETPYLCPPGCVMVIHEDEAQVRRLHVHLAERPPRPEE
jgi:RNA polymerase sigma factor (sigma-70 family)